MHANTLAPPTSRRRLTPQQRLARGLTHTATGPVDVSRGAVGIGVQSARRGAVQLRRTSRKGLRSLLIAGAAVMLLAAGGAAFAIVRRRSRPEELSVRPPSVDVAAKP
ncbi:MAG TPA: cell wall synthesis protein CwsA [Mycobacterium sp.]|nr:cell wall synthesis protein CwsA [Mycobacterium sp.]